MAARRIFLGWEAPVAGQVCNRLLAEAPGSPVDLGHLLIIVPTRQAGRHLRESLARACASAGTALLSPQVLTPGILLQPQSARLAGGAALMAAWVSAIRGTNIEKLTGLFPVPPPEPDFERSLELGLMLQRLRDLLSDGALRISDVAGRAGPGLEEPERWRDLAELESRYLDRLAASGREDPCEARIRHASQIRLAPPVTKVVLAAVPDPTPLLVLALKRLAEQADIDVLVHAPASEAGAFDEWGRPAPAIWSERQIDVLEPDRNIAVAASPAAQSGQVIELMAGEAARFAPGDIAVGVPDPEVAPFLAADLAARRLPAYDPAGVTLSAHRLFHLLSAFSDLLTTGRYESVSALLRHPDALRCLTARQDGGSPAGVLSELDEFQNRHLPQSFDDFVALLRSPDSPLSAREHESLATLAGAVGTIGDWVDRFTGARDFESGIRSLLVEIYAARSLGQSEQDDEFRAAAESVATVLSEFDSGLLAQLEISAPDASVLLLRRLETETIYPDHQAAIDLEGWLELPWNEAPFLIVTGMNEGSVPNSQTADLFMPDSLRALLGLRHDRDRLARDAYVMQALIESRRQGGRVAFIAGRTSDSGDPLKPSRLLFRCGRQELPQRACRLFGQLPERACSPPPSVSFLLNPRPVPGLKMPEAISVTGFRDYLACPFRFYLRHVLRMEPLSDEKTEMDALDFGTLVHRAFQAFTDDEGMRRCEDAGALQGFLQDRARGWAHRHYGKRLPLQVIVALEAANQRLAAAARAQSALRREGWEVLCGEIPVEMNIGPLKVKGRIDRVDLHPQSGRVRLIDYKTSDTAQEPAGAHFAAPTNGMPHYSAVTVGGRPQRWIDLQLPLYRMLYLAANPGVPADRIELVYFNLPKAVSDTAAAAWSGFDEDLAQSAAQCAAGVTTAIANRLFWPPSDAAEPVDFDFLFPAGAADCIDGPAFLKALGEASA